MRFVLTLLAAAGGAFGQSRITAIVNTADYTPRVAFHALATLFGENLTTCTRAATIVPLPNELCGVSIEFTDAIGAQALAPLLYVSPTQINFQIPVTQWLNGKDSIRREAVVATVRACVKPSNACTDLPLESEAPAIFLYRRGDVVDPIIVHANGQLVTPANPATWRETLVLYATGFGYQDTGFPRDGVPAPTDRLVEIVDRYPTQIETGKVGGLSIGSTLFGPFAGLAPGFIGLQQINFEMPSQNGRTEAFIFLKGYLAGQSQTVRVYVR